MLTAVLTPLWINLWGSQPFDPAKIGLLRWLIWPLAAVWLVDWLQRPRSWRIELPPLPLLLPLVALAIIAGLSSVTAVNPSLSLWGGRQRAYGLLTLITYLLLMLIVSGRLRSLEQVRRLLTFLVVASIPLISVGVLQAAGQDPLPLTSDARSPIYATLGRANFVGAYLALLLPLTLSLALTAPQRHIRAGLYILALAQLALLGLTLARAAWLGAGAGLLLVLAGRAWPHLSRRGRYGLGVTAGLLLAGSGLLAARSFAVAEGGSIAARRVIWQATVTLIGERPLLGHGLDALAVQFMRVFPPQLVYYQGRQVFVDRAHNWLLDTSVTIGVLGLLATLWLWGAAFWYGWRAARRWQASGQREKGMLLVGCLAAVGANLAGNLFSFDVAATAVAGWLLLASIISLGREDEDRLWPTNPSWWRFGAAGILLGAGLWSGWWTGGRFLAADMAHQRSLQLAAQPNWPMAGAAADQAVTLWPQEPGHWQTLAELQAAQGAWDAAGASWKQAVNLRPNDPVIRAEMGQFYLALAQQGEANAQPRAITLARAEAALLEAITLAPNIARFYVLQGQVHLLAGRWQAGVDQLTRALDLDATDGLAWSLLADAYAAQGQLIKAEAAYQEAERWRNAP